ncbi:MAG: transcriptional regulator (amidase domain and AraC-type DNA-binding HTH domain containing protein) [Solidesulfovibrio magneticus str. Maddingley MBC34]|uniref:Transcriptional regulator (Amidase domain and AraC-type DNA-binding HTH domain containing protein) n=1 Tax=Solidesulfovibrio magneticus str. Maddingley MBC34 TaxID=1206767 RepID=K6H549_9BACT|nr:MAG: transcriptional regulator (amidase domain and AraC-type DNA-binding HTH domain containing protein) [Solidesulfovibrio magneticus str. Maddingley MBC34]
MQRIDVTILLFPGVELLDFAGPYEALAVCRLDEARRREDVSPFAVRLAAASLEPVACANGPRILPDLTLVDGGAPDILLVPGGWGVRAAMHDVVLIDWIREAGLAAKAVAGVCTGSMLLGQAGLLDGRLATTHWRSLDWMRQSFPSVTVLDDRHVVEDGRTFTSAGISAGIDLGLRLVAHFYGEALAEATAAQMEYYSPSDNRRRVTLAKTP